MRKVCCDLYIQAYITKVIIPICILWSIADVLAATFGIVQLQDSTYYEPYIAFTFLVTELIYMLGFIFISFTLLMAVKRNEVGGIRLWLSVSLVLNFIHFFAVIVATTVLTIWRSNQEYQKQHEGEMVSFGPYFEKKNSSMSTIPIKIHIFDYTMCFGEYIAQVAFYLFYTHSFYVIYVYEMQMPRTSKNEQVMDFDTDVEESEIDGDEITPLDVHLGPPVHKHG